MRPENSRAKFSGSSLDSSFLNATNLGRVKSLNAIARDRGQTLAQMAIAWVLRDRRVTSALIGARTVEQLDDSLDALKKLDFSHAELKVIEQHAQESGIDIWKGAREGTE